MKIGLGKLIEIDFKFWLKSNDYYSDKKMTTNVKTGFNHVSKAGLIRKYKENLKTNQDLINLIKQKIKQKNETIKVNDKPPQAPVSIYSKPKSPPEINFNPMKWLTMKLSGIR
mgnify:CR=1 FL=1